MATPSKVKEQAARATKLQEQLGNPDATPAPTPAQPAPTPEPTPTPADTPPQPGSPEPPAASREKDLETRLAQVESRLSVVQGKYNAEVPRLHQQLKDAEATIKSLQAENESLKAAKPSPAQPQGSPLTPEEQQKLADMYGEEFIDTLNRMTSAKTAELQSQVDTLKGQIGELTNRTAATEQVVIKSAEERFWDDLTDAVKDWEAVNSNPEFLAWLNEEDPLAGEPRGELFQRAYQKRDAVRVAKFFTSWKESKGAPTPTPDLNTKPKPKVDPPRGKGGGNPPAPAHKMWKRSEINQFFEDKRRGVYRGRETEAKALENDIFAAQSSNRIIDG